MNKVRAIVLALFVAGFTASYALAGNGHGHGKKGSHAAVSTSTTTTGTETDTDSTETDTTETETNASGAGHKGHPKKVTLCHKAGKSGRYVKVRVAAPAAKARIKHGDVLAAADGSCPAPAASTTTPTDTTTTP